MPKKIYNLQYKHHKLVSVKRHWLFWRPITRMQEWLEEKDKPLSKIIAYSLLLLAGIYFAVALFRG